MTLSLLRRSVVAASLALFVLPAAHCAGQEAPAQPAAPEAPAKPKFLRAVELATQEVQDVLESSPHLGRNIERLVGFQFSPATARLLEETIGTAQPMHLERLGQSDGQDAWRVLMPAREHVVGDGVSMRWTESPTELRVDKSGRRLNSTGTWAALDINGKDTRFALRDMRGTTSHRLGKGKLWFGTVQVGARSVALETLAPAPAGQQAQPVTVTMQDLDFNSNTTERAATMDIVQRMRIGSIEVAGERVNNLIMNYRLNQIDKQNMIEMTARQRQIRNADGDAERETTDLLAMFRDMARASSKAGTALTIDRISADYGGHTFTLQGRVALKGAKESDFDDLAQLFKRVDARFDIAVPVALVKAGALAAAKRQLAAAGQANQDPAAMAQTMTDVVVGKLLGEGFARLDKGVLRATITVRAGQLRVNGKEVSLPKPQHPQPVPNGGPMATMPARQVTGSCAMPDYPKDVVERDALLMLGLRVHVDQTGVPGEVTIVDASAYPDYDKLVVAAVASCRYVPALQGNTPVATTVPIVIIREQGSARP